MQDVLSQLLAQANLNLQLRDLEHSVAEHGESQPQGRRGNRLCVGGLPENVDADELLKHFGRWGPVQDIYFPRLQHGGRANYSFVTLANGQMAQRCLAESPLRINGKVSLELVYLMPTLKALPLWMKT